MKLNPQSLAKQLSKPLLPIYLVSGDEPLIVAECSDAIRQAARDQGFQERQVFSVERGFDWQALTANTSAMSLFAEKKLIEVRMPTGKAGKEGAQTLLKMAQNPVPDTMVMVITGKLDRSVASTKWVKAIESEGAHVQIWPLEVAHLPRWIEQRMRGLGLAPDRDAVGVIVERVEGNLLAAKQEIDKLLLLHGQGSISADQVAEAVADSARYDIFKCVDAALMGNLERTHRVLHGLRGEGVEPVLLVWAVTREIQSLAAMAWEIERGASSTSVLGRVWAKRKPVLGAALQRHSLQSLQHLLLELSRVDRISKGQLRGNPWDALRALLCRVANPKNKLAYGLAV